MKLIAIIAALLISCSSKPSAPSPTPPVQADPTPSPPPDEPPVTTTPPPTTPPPLPPTPNDPPPTPMGSAGSAAPAGPGMAEKCGDADACAAGLECVKYYGIAGARGPQFKTCEKRCKVAGDCPTDRKCRTIADGPGQVCR